MDSYHKKYTDLPDTEIQNRLNEKKGELIQIFTTISPKSTYSVIKLAVLGCGDKRFIKGHKQIFEEVLKKTVEVTTFDITTEHLGGEERVIEHDCTIPIPNGPFTITYAHILLKFIKTEKQQDLIKNSYDILEPGGLAIHVMDKEDYSTEGKGSSGKDFKVPLERLEKYLEDNKIQYKKIPVKFGLALVLIK